MTLNNEGLGISTRSPKKKIGFYCGDLDNENGHNLVNFLEIFTSVFDIVFLRHPTFAPCNNLNFAKNDVRSLYACAASLNAPRF